MHAACNHTSDWRSDVTTMEDEVLQCVQEWRLTRLMMWCFMKRSTALRRSAATQAAKDNVLLVKTAKQACANTDDTCIVNLKRVPHGSFPHIASSILLRTFPPVVHLEDKIYLLRFESSLKPWKTSQKVFRQPFFCDIYSNLTFAHASDERCSGAGLEPRHMILSHRLSLRKQI